MKALPPGTMLGGYEIRRKLGCGGQGIVYEAWDAAFARPVAIKTTELDDIGLARFQRGAEVSGRLNHQNIVQAYYYGRTADLAYIVMQFVNGPTLKSVLEAEERLPLHDTLRIMDDLLDALQHCHDRGVIHRDIKPANVILDAERCAKLTDFGIARIENSDLTQAGTVIGAPAYMSPEQFKGQAVDRRTDIYSCGVLLYELLTGKRPFEGSLTDIMHQVLYPAPPKFLRLPDTVPPAFNAVVARSMALQLKDRYDSAAQLKRALHEAASHAFPDPDKTVVVGRSTERGMSRRLPLVLSAAVLAAAFGGAALMLLRRDVDPSPTVVVLNSQSGTKPPPAPPDTPVSPPLPPAPDPSATPNQPAAAPSGSGVMSGSTEVQHPLPSMPSFPGPDVSSREPAPTLQEPAHPPVSSSATDPRTELRRAVAAALASVPCSLLGGDVSTAQELRLTGLARKGEENTIRGAVARAAPAMRTASTVVPFEGPYCPALEVLRPVAGQFGAPTGLSAATVGGRTRYVENDTARISVDMPAFPAWLRVDYLDSSGQATHAHPTAGATAPETFPAGAHLEVGDPSAGFSPIQIGGTLGIDMLLVVVSEAPLFSAPRPEAEPTGSYLHDLADAIVAVRRDGKSVAATALVLVTVPRAASGGGAGQAPVPRRGQKETPGTR